MWLSSKSSIISSSLGSGQKSGTVTRFRVWYSINNLGLPSFWCKHDEKGSLKWRRHNYSCIQPLFQFLLHGGVVPGDCLPCAIVNGRSLVRLNWCLIRTSTLLKPVGDHARMPAVSTLFRTSAFSNSRRCSNLDEAKSCFSSSPGGFWPPVAETLPLLPESPSQSSYRPKLSNYNPQNNLTKTRETARNRW